MPRCVVVVPCYNEAKRLQPDEFLRLARAGVSLQLVDDGSQDDTFGVLCDLAAKEPESLHVLRLQVNSGKSEAVRRGLLAAIATGAPWVGFADADLATPVEEVVRLAAIAEQGKADAVLGSRIAMAGTQIDRHAIRHYFGRVFATAAAHVLQSRFYDTQCGAKFFRNTPGLSAALAAPFQSRWVFDVELLGRLLSGDESNRGLPLEAFREVPLERWRDVPGTRIRPRDLANVGSDLFVIWRDLQKRRHGAAASRVRSPCDGTRRGSSGATGT